MTTITADGLISGGGAAPCAARTIAVSGRTIAEVAATPGAAVGGGRRLILPALANAHDHARIVRASAMGGLDEPLESWIFRLAMIPSVDPWLASMVSYGRTALGGVGSVMTQTV